SEVPYLSSSLGDDRKHRKGLLRHAALGSVKAEAECPVADGQDRGVDCEGSTKAEDAERPLLEEDHDYGENGGSEGEASGAPEDLHLRIAESFSLATLVVDEGPVGAALRKNPARKTRPAFEGGESSGKAEGREQRPGSLAGKGRYSCTECGQRCPSSSHLKIHSRVHTGERPFECGSVKTEDPDRSAPNGRDLEEDSGSGGEASGAPEDLPLRIAESFSLATLAVDEGPVGAAPRKNPARKTRPAFEGGESSGKAEGREQRPGSLAGKGRYSCTECGQRCRTPSLLKTHSRVHTGERPFECGAVKTEDPDRSAPNGRDLEEDSGSGGEASGAPEDLHLRIAESFSLATLAVDEGPVGAAPRKNPARKTRPAFEGGESSGKAEGREQRPGSLAGKGRYSCTECGRHCPSSSHLKIHSRVHTGERPFECGVCGMKFIQKSNLTTHSRIHTGVRPYECGVCWRKFSLKTHLSRHSLIHTGEKPFECDFCGKKFADQSHFARHKRLHTGVKPFECDDCGSKFARKDELRSHMTHKHLAKKP
ncbi:zinc finger protein 436-like, partial [Thrips palmi]|uniref:Zinc finger protein 436-like n=1 Tax=Thrips palmi TaxID=161013 RepID=A0A6P8YAG4_THRPL